MIRVQYLTGLTVVLIAAQASAQASAQAKKGGPDLRAKVMEVLKKSFNAKGAVTLERLEQEPLQIQCSSATPLPDDAQAKIRTEQQATVKFPEDGGYLGKWQDGEKVAQDGFGLQFSDDGSKPNGGNCYACHQLAKSEVAYGTLGPPLYQYGKLRGNSEAILKFAWSKLWNSNGSVACSNMPRFGQKGILTETQLRDVMAYLFDPESPVNK